MLKYLKNHPLIQSILVLILVILMVKTVGNHTSFANKNFGHIGSFCSNLMYFVSSKISFSIGDVFYTLLAILLFIEFIYLIKCCIQKNWRKLKKILSYTIYGITIIYFIFNLFWGFNYYKKPINEIYNSELNSVDELKELADFYYAQAKYYRQLVKEDENGVFKTTLTQNQINLEFEKASKNIQHKYPELKFINNLKTNLKPSIYSEAISYMGISGYYNPFTSESQFNSKVPDSKLIFTQLHETAHQFGFAPESEANFIGFLIGIESQHPDILYAANFKAMRSLLNRILWFDPLYVKNYVDNLYTEGMKRDREYEIEINQKYTGKGDELFSLMNEAFLKMNNQEGLESYGRFVELLVGFNREYDLLK